MVQEGGGARLVDLGRDHQLLRESADLNSWKISMGVLLTVQESNAVFLLVN